MVCLGNICRSPLAQGIMESKVKAKDLNWEVDSCGTGSWHIGEAPDKRSIEVARKNGIDISHQRARQFAHHDIKNFDVILAMDANNYNDIIRSIPKEGRDKVNLILNFQYPGENRTVPDPYFNGGFDYVYEILDDACDHVISKLQFEL